MKYKSFFSLYISVRIAKPPCLSTLLSGNDISSGVHQRQSLIDTDKRTQLMELCDNVGL